MFHFLIGCQAGKRKVVSSIVRQSVKAVYDGNGHQSDPQLSTKKLTKTFQAWQKRGFSLVDRSTWRNSGVVLGNDFSFSNKELEGIAYFSQILKADLQTTADATRHLLRLLVGNPTGQMSVSYVEEVACWFWRSMWSSWKSERISQCLGSGRLDCSGCWIYPRTQRQVVASWRTHARKVPFFYYYKQTPLSIYICVPFPIATAGDGTVLPLLQQTNPLSASIICVPFPL